MRPSARYRPFAVSMTPAGEETVLAAVGELDLVSADRFAREIERVRAAGSTKLVLDLRDVDFIDSTGLRVLLCLRNDAKRDSHALTLIPPSAHVGRVFEITGTRGLFDWRNAGQAGDA